MGGRWEGVAPAGVLALVCAVSALLLTVAPPRAELVEVDGISLDSHAAAELSNGGGSGQRAGSSALSMHLSHMNSKSINKLLKDNEKGEIDGISLDSRAMAELNGGAPAAHASHDSHAARKSKASSRAQRLLDEGKQELDSRQWKAAVRLFARAKRIWRRQNNEQYKWADSLEHDVLRLHPGAKPAGVHSAHTQTENPRPDMRTAVKQLSSGHAFRSLYGLLRDQHATEAAQRGEGVAKKAVQEAARVIAPYRSLMDASAPARTQALVQVKRSGKSKMDSAVALAEHELERKGKMELLHEKAKIVKMARQLARAAAAKATDSEVRLGAPPAQLLQGHPMSAPGAQLVQAPLQTWSSSVGPQGQQQEWTIAQGQSLAQGAGPDTALRPMSEYLQRQNREMESRVSFPGNEQHLPLTEQVHNALMRQVPAAAEKAIDERPALHRGAATPYERFHKRGRFHYDLDQVQPRYPSAAPPFAPQPPQATASEPSSPLEMREQVSGRSKVPVVNINLPHGQVVPPGQYYMDGSLVEDLAGHWDYVGKLVPASPRESAV
jgi:hypothetical protein